MIRWTLLALTVLTATAKSTDSEESESVPLFLLKMLVFAVGLATAAGELYLYAMSFRRTDVVEFAVYGTQPPLS